MKQFNVCLGAALLLALISVSGCNNTASGNVETEKKLKESFSNKEFDINKVPPEQRARVQALMGANSAASKDAGKTTAASAPPAKP
ncbi:MAG: hypothetical protein H8F28_09565 [Fibrella sp.]|nr:hypothetical protein [Armatimonadota bacterium]